VSALAGTGKTTMIGALAACYAEAGWGVVGVAPTGRAARELRDIAGVPAGTMHSLLGSLQRGHGFAERTVLVIDEAGMIGSRQMERVISEVEKRGAKVVLVGDPEQLQAIEAGAAFRSIAERHGSVEITDIRRQREDWQRAATRQLATGRTGEAVQAYEQAGHVHAADTRDAARADLVGRWDRDRATAPEASRIILTHTRDEVEALNTLARDRLRHAGQLGDDVTIKTERGERSIAAGDRIMFLKNERSLGVKNGSLGIVQSVTSARMAVMLDDGRAVAFDVKDYANVDHGYAATIHKAQGVTVDRVHVLATPGIDRHAAYVALSRHRDHVDMHYGRDDFADQGKLTRTLSRERAKDMASDYRHAATPESAFADRRGIPLRERVVEAAKVLPDKVRQMFDGLRLTIEPPAPKVEAPQESIAAVRDRAITRHARAVQAIFAMQDRGGNASPDQLTYLSESRRDLNGLRQHAAADAESAYARDASLLPEAARGETERARLAILREREVRTNPELRADRFVERWNRLSAGAERAYVSGDYERRRSLQDGMRGMAQSLERDPQMESILANRKQQLGISVDTGRKLGAELAFHQGIDLGRGRGLGIGMRGRWILKRETGKAGERPA
ncbi:MAG: AAA family ATPase, partial [Pseudomonadota bacterium]|nr:AAA family ATPase [Pseudomonadota bacterium]